MKVFSNGCRVFHPDEGDTISKGTLTFRRPISRANGAAGIAQTVSRYKLGHAPARMNPGGEEVHFVVTGRGIAWMDGVAYPIESGTAFYTPANVVLMIENLGEGLLRVVSVACPEDSEATTVAVEEIQDPLVHGPPRCIHEREASSVPAGDRQFKLLVGKSLGCDRITQFIGLIPMGRAPQHHHSYEEAIYILEGKGRVWAGDEQCEFVPGTSIYLPIGTRHSLENLDREWVRLLGVFYPSGSPAVSYP